MRVCRIMKSFPRDTSPGAGLHPFFLTVKIKEPTLVITRKMPGKKREVPNYVIVKEVPYSTSSHTGVDVLSGGISVFARRMMENLSFFWNSLPHIMKFKPEIVHLHSPAALPQGILAKFLLKAHLIATLHGTDRLYLKKIKPVRWLMRFCDEICYVSTAMQQELSELFPRVKLEYTPSCVDLWLFKNLSKRRKNQIIAVGAFKWQKGYEYLIEAMGLLGDENYQLFIAGDGPTRRQIEEQIKTYNLNDMVELLGIISQDKLVHYLNESKVFVLSSVSEGFPKVILEAMACGAPVVATDVGSCREIVGDKAGIIVPPKNPEAMAEAIHRLISDTRLWEDCSHQALQIAQKYDWTSTANKVWKIYKELVHQSP